ADTGNPRRTVRRTRASPLPPRRRPRADRVAGRPAQRPAQRSVESDMAACTTGLPRSPCEPNPVGRLEGHGYPTPSHLAGLPVCRCAARRFGESQPCWCNAAVTSTLLSRKDLDLLLVDRLSEQRWI